MGMTFNEIREYLEYRRLWLRLFKLVWAWLKREKKQHRARHPIMFFMSNDFDISIVGSKINLNFVQNKEILNGYLYNGNNFR
jgi:hypothetical protein